MHIARRIALLSWVFATFLMFAYIVDAEGFPAPADAVYWSAPLLTALLAVQAISCGLRRRFYGGIAIAGIAGNAAVFGAGVLGDRADVQLGHEVFAACFEDYANRNFPGWTYTDHWPVQRDAGLCDAGPYRIATTVASIEHEGTGYMVFGTVQEAAAFAGWADASFFLYPLDPEGRMITDGEPLIRWPS